MKDKLEPWKIELVEDLPLRADDKWYVLLALTGHKHGSWLQLESDTWREGDEQKSIAEEVNKITAILDKLGILYSVRFRDPEPDTIWQSEEGKGLRTRIHQLVDIFIATSKDWLNELVNAVENMDHKRIGRALAYPETAVEVFGTDRAIFSDDVDNDDIDERVKKAAWIALSKDNYHKELVVVGKWLDILDANSAIVSAEVDRLAEMCLSKGRKEK